MVIDEFILVCKNLQHYPQLSLDSGRLDNCTTVHAANIKDSVIGNNITINTSKNQNIKIAPI